MSIWVTSLFGSILSAVIRKMSQLDLVSCVVVTFHVVLVGGVICDASDDKRVRRYMLLKTAHE